MPATKKLTYAEKQKAKNEARYKELIKMWDDPALKTVCTPITPEEVTKLNVVSIMWEAFNLSPNGIGLAAPQVGILKNVILIAPRDKHPLVMFNTVITYLSDEKETDQEGCLSYPEIFCPVERSKKIEVKYNTLNVSTSGGKTTLGFDIHDAIFEGIEARIIQHEVEHTLGICKVGDYWRSINKKD